MSCSLFKGLWLINWWINCKSISYSQSWSILENSVAFLNILINKERSLDCCKARRKWLEHESIYGPLLVSLHLLGMSRCTTYERMLASIAQIWNIVASRLKFDFTPTFIFCSTICPNSCGVVFLWKYMLVFEKWFFFVRSLKYANFHPEFYPLCDLM